MEIWGGARVLLALVVFQFGTIFANVSLAESGIVAPLLAEDKTQVKLAGTVERRAVGGGGRYLAFTIPTLRQVAVFDVNQAKVVKYLPADDSDIHVAAGKDKLIIVLGTKKIAFRYSLVDFKREQTTELGIASEIAHICMGSGSDGPLLIARAGRDFNARDYGLTFLDVQKLAPMTLKSKEQNVHSPEWGKASSLEATADGQTFLLHGAMVLRVVDGSLVRLGGQSHGTGLRYSQICPRGRFVYGSGTVFALDLRPLGQPPQGSYVYNILIPGCEGNYYLNCNTGDQNFSNRNRTGATTSLHLSGPGSPLIKLEGINLYEGGSPRQHPAHPPGFEKSLFFVPSANMLIQIPLSNDKIILHRINVGELLDKSGVDYLFVQSQAPTKSKPGETYRYKINVQSKTGDLKFKLASAPKGMKISKDGEITWAIPSDFPYSDASIIAEVTDKLSQQVLHTFHIETGGKGGTAPDAIVEESNDIVTTSDYSKLPPITPLVLDSEERKVQLPAAFDDVKIGGGGRYLILMFKSLKKLGVFDVCQGKITGYIPIPDADCGYAAGANRLVIVSSAKGLVTRYEIATRKRELTRTFAAGVLAQVFMGSASAGPVYVSTSMQTHSVKLTQMNLSDLAPTPVKFDGNSSRGFSQRARVKISSNGQTIGVWEVGVSPSGLQTYVNQGDVWKSHYEHDSVGSIVPSADGSLIFTNSGIFTSQLSPKQKDQGYGYSPATLGEFYLRQAFPDRSRNSKPGKLTLHKIGDDRPLLTLGYGVFGDGNDTWGRSMTTLEQRAILVPGTNVIVTVPETRDSLVLKRFDLDAELEASGVDYLFVVSHASGTVKLGEQYEHQVEVKSKSGDVNFKIESGPEGMVISKTGKITWTVPDSFEGDSSTVIVSINDKSGQELFHTFKLGVSGAAERIQAMRAEAERKRKLEADKMRIAAESRRQKILEEQRRQQEMRRLQDEKTRAEKIAARTKWLAIKEKAIAEDDASKAKVTPPRTYEERTWTDTSSSKIRASYVQVFAGSIILRLTDGSQIAVPGARLSEGDRAYAANAYGVAKNADENLKRLEKERIERQGDQATRRGLEQQSIKKMQQIANAIRASVRRTTIPTGSFDTQSKTLLLSWRVHLLPHLGESDLYRQFRLDEPWFSEHNRKLIDQMPDVFKAPGSAAALGKTTYLAVTSSQSVFANPADNKRSNSIYGVGKYGTFVETGDHQAVTWTRPDDLDLKTGDRGESMRFWFGQRDDGMLIAFIDGHVQKLLADNDLSVAAQLFSRATSYPALNFANDAIPAEKEDLQNLLFGRPQ